MSLTKSKNSNTNKSTKNKSHKSKSHKSKSPKNKSHKSKSHKSKVLRVYTNSNGNEKFNYISKSEAKKHMQQRHTRKDRYFYKKNKKMSNNKQNGGFFADPSCNLAIIKEPSFNIPEIGNVAGLNIAESRALIYNPNCKKDTSQAMM